MTTIASTLPKNNDVNPSNELTLPYTVLSKLSLLEQKLPPKMLIHIISYLGGQNLYSLSLTSKYIKQTCLTESIRVTTLAIICIDKNFISQDCDTNSFKEKQAYCGELSKTLFNSLNKLTEKDREKITEFEKIAVSNKVIHEIYQFSEKWHLVTQIEKDEDSKKVQEDLIALATQEDLDSSYHLAVLKKVTLALNPTIEIEGNAKNIKVALFNLALKLIDRNNIDQALALLAKIGIKSRRELYSKLALLLLIKGEEKKEAFEKIIKAAGNFKERNILFRELANVLIKEKKYALALQMVDRLSVIERIKGQVVLKEKETLAEKNTALHALIKILVNKRNYEQASLFAEKISHPIQRDVSLEYICSKLIEDKKLEQALEIIEKITDVEKKQKIQKKISLLKEVGI